MDRLRMMSLRSGYISIPILAVFLLVPRVAQAQPAAGGHDDHVAPAVEYPSFHLTGFADVNFASQDAAEGARGFTEGQFVLHMASALSSRVSVFGELSFSPRTDAGTGTPPATGYNAEVERAIIRFAQSDYLKLSFGRYHTPINWWNTAYHHGQWLQTTISRPEMIQFGGRFMPVHFIGGLVEGSLPAKGWNVGYQAGVGNGRGNVISRGGDAGDNNARPAYLVNVFTKPDRAYGLQVGASAYFDRISLAGRPEYEEQIFSAHMVWQHENPELIAEVSDVRHEQVGGGTTSSNFAYYAQAAYRLPAPVASLKPYYRFERINIAATDPIFTTVPKLVGSTIGLRYDITTFAAIKTEARIRRRDPNLPLANGWFFQVAFTF